MRLYNNAKCYFNSHSASIRLLRWWCNPLFFASPPPFHSFELSRCEKSLHKSKNRVREESPTSVSRSNFSGNPYRVDHWIKVVFICVCVCVYLVSIARLGRLTTIKPFHNWWFCAQNSSDQFYSLSFFLLLSIHCMTHHHVLMKSICYLNIHTHTSNRKSDPKHIHSFWLQSMNLQSRRFWRRTTFEWCIYIWHVSTTMTTEAENKRETDVEVYINLLISISLS